ncbi:MAG TPA: hypothetical protein PKX05_02175, partial [bacterium]|nr:hypothetical protein [bacterium]
MKRLNVALFLCLYLSITGFCQDMEIPEEIITGFDRTLYKTPLFFYQYPIEPAFPEIKSPNSSRQIIEQSGPDEVIKGQQIFSQFSLIGGKFNQISSDLLVKNKETNMHLSLLNDDSFRSNDNKRIIDASFEKQLTDHILFDVGYRNSRKEMPGPTYRPFDRKKYTTLFKSGFLFSNQDYTIGINGIYNTLEELEEKQESFIFKKYYEKFIFKTEIGHNEFGGKENTIFDLSACKDDQNYQIGLAIKTIGDQTRLLPEAMITMGKGDVSLSAGIVSDFSFPDLWIKAGDSSYLTMENVFLLPEEKYRIYSMLNFNIADTQIGFNGQVSYEKTSYQWRDMD